MEVLKISPEGMEIANVYLQFGHDSARAAQELNLPIEVVTGFLEKPEVKRYIDRVFAESGYRNRDKMAEVWDAVLQAKLQELHETGLGSQKDIIEILEKMHKFKMAELELQMKAAAAATPQIQINQQNNYNSLLEKLTGGSK